MFNLITQLDIPSGDSLTAAPYAFIYKPSCLFFVSRTYNMSDIISPKSLCRSTQLFITMCQNPKTCAWCLAVRLNHFKSSTSVCYERKVTRRGSKSEYLLLETFKHACVSNRCGMWCFILKSAAVCQKVIKVRGFRCCLLSTTARHSHWKPHCTAEICVIVLTFVLDYFS